MISYGQKTLNKNDVRDATLKFILSFAMLAGLSFLAVFLFFKSSRMQSQNTQREMDAYREMLGRHELLRIKVDTIYKKMQMLGNDRVENDMFLRNSIIEDVAISRNLIGKDSTGNLKPYMALLTDLDPMLAMKNNLLKLNTEKAAAQRNLEECIGSSTQVRQRMETQAAPKRKLGRLFSNAKR